MKPPALKVGARAVHVERIGGWGKPREILRTTVVRETATQWIDAHGDRWRKKDGSRVQACHGCEPRYLMTEAEFAAVDGAS